jgi:ankyrin repeat protein
MCPARVHTLCPPKAHFPCTIRAHVRTCARALRTLSHSHTLRSLARVHVQLQAAIACLIRDRHAKSGSGRTSPRQLESSIAALPEALLDAPLPSSGKSGNLLLWAVRNGNEAAVRLLIARGANVNSTCTPKRSAPLMSAAFEGFERIIAILLRAGADVNHANAQGYTPLIVAAMQGRATCVELLLRAGARVDQPMTLESAATALLAASQQGHARCVELLLRAGASVDQSNENGDVPLGAAAYKGQAACVRLILDAGAKVDHFNARGATPLGLACYAGHAACAALMLERGAAIDHRAYDGRTPMYAACRLGHAECAQLLSSYGALRMGIGSLPGSLAPMPEQQVRPATAEMAAQHFGFGGLAHWLQRTQGWTPLHHLEQLGPERCLALLRGEDRTCSRLTETGSQGLGDTGGASLHARPASGDDRRTPLERAVELDPPTPTSSLVRLAAEPWSTHNHHTFPARGRRRAVELLMVGHQLSSEPRFVGVANSILDVWMHVVMAHAVTRDAQ